MDFTAHNILLDDGTKTLGDGVPLLGDTQLCRAMIRTVNLHFPEGHRSGIRVADLGCLEGGYAVEFARQGFDVTGIEAREDNINKCSHVAGHLSLPNLTFIQDDVKNLANHGTFDVIFCGGLLYHLDKPVEFLHLLGRVTTRMLLLNTHYSWPSDPLYDGSARVKKLRKKYFRNSYNPGKFDYDLSRLDTNEGIEGRWFKEYDPRASRDDVEKSLWAAYSNYRSFWPTKKYLLQTLRDSGFSVIYEQYDILEDMLTDNFIDNLDRSLFVALKEAPKEEGLPSSN